MARLEAHDITVALGRRAVLRNVDFALAAGSLCGVIGPNGAGKTTLIRALARLTPLAGGTITLDGESIDRIPGPNFARRIGYLPQGAQAEWPLSAARLVALGRLPHLGAWQRLKECDARVIARALDEVNAAALAGRPFNELSQGERARVLLARALASEPAVLLADEPVAALDPAHQLQIMELLKARARAGASVVVVLHDLSLAARFCDRLTLLCEGARLAEGSVCEVLSDDNLERAYGVRALRASDPSGRPYVLPWARLPAGHGPAARAEDGRR